MACFTNWVQMFFWLRLFDSSAQYVDLIIDTVKDVYEFTKVLLILLITFAMGFYMIQINRVAAESGDDVVPVYPQDDTDSTLSVMYDCLLFVYKIVLGDFENATLIRSRNGIDGSMQVFVMLENSLTTFYFLGTTFFTQITILNMLIAIMSATYSKHSENLGVLGQR